MLEKSKEIWKAIQRSCREVRQITCFLTAVIFVWVQVVSPANFAFAEEPPFTSDPLNHSVPVIPVTSDDAEGEDTIQQGTDMPLSAHEASPVPGDVNGDLKVNLDDLDAIASAGLYETGEPATREQGDLNGDGLVDSSDIVVMFKNFGLDLSPEVRAAEPPLPVPGDVNGDLKVSLEDLDAISAAGLYETGEPATREQGDLNGDGIVDSSDIVLMFQNFGLDLSEPVMAENEPVIVVTGDLTDGYGPGQTVRFTVIATDQDATDTVNITLDKVFYVVPEDQFTERPIDPAAYSYDSSTGEFTWQLPPDPNFAYRYFARFVAASTKAGEGGHGGTAVEEVEISLRASDHPNENYPQIAVTGLAGSYELGQTVHLTVTATDEDTTDMVGVGVNQVFYVIPGDSRQHPIDSRTYSQVDPFSGEFTWELPADLNLDYRYFVNFFAASTNSDPGGYGGSAYKTIEIYLSTQ